jgi:hypothetical protein
VDRSKRTVRGAVLAALLGLAATAGLAAGAGPKSMPKAKMPEGTWGGEHISLEVGPASSRLDYDCAEGTIEGPITLDRRGRFEARGRHTKEGPGPQRVGGEGSGEAARYVGTVKGDVLELLVTLAGSGETVGKFVLTRGKPGRVRKCL